MPKYSSDFIRKVSDANDIVDIISQYVPLKQKGNTYSACCPFHNEKTPSFHVDRDKQLYHCFGCGVGGDIYKFLMEKEGMSFYEALKYLAEKAGIDLPSGYDDKKAKEDEEKRERLFKINESTANFFYKNLIKSREAQDYLHKRGITNTEIKKYGLGLAPSGWDNLKNYLLNAGFKMKDLLEAGVVVLNRNKTNQYDRFRERITFPIQNVMNKVIGFGARLITDDKNQPKYLNTPETNIFKKGRELYNLNRAKNKLRGSPLILVEGYIDVIALDSYGIENCAAALGTSFTSNHIKLISRYTKDVVLCFDGDSAGEKATLRALSELGADNTLNVSIVRLPEKDDPDSFIRQYGKEAFLLLVNDAMSATDFKLFLSERDNDLSTSSGLFNYVNESLQHIKGLGPIEQEFYLKRISDTSKISTTSLKEQLGSVKKVQTYKEEPTQKSVQNIKEKEPVKRISRALKEAQIVYLLFCYDDPRVLDEIPTDYLPVPFFKWLHLKLKDLNIKRPDILSQCDEDERERYEKSLIRLLVEERGKIDITDTSLLERSIEIINKFNRQKKIDSLSSSESLLLTGDEQKSSLFSSIIEIKKVDF